MKKGNGYIEVERYLKEKEQMGLVSVWFDVPFGVTNDPGFTIMTFPKTWAKIIWPALQKINNNLVLNASATYDLKGLWVYVVLYNIERG